MSGNSEINHASRAHARLNASSSHRWMMCPPSVKLSENFADTPSQYAEEGTYLHELCELKLHNFLGDKPPDFIISAYDALKALESLDGLLDRNRLAFEGLASAMTGWNRQASTTIDNLRSIVAAAKSAALRGGRCF